MTPKSEEKRPVTPRGKKKGGTMFPRASLDEVLVYAKKLVAKTHTGSQPSDVIMMGVIGSKHGKGQVGMSALKQYGLMEGDAKTNFSATDLARKIAAAPEDELVPLYRQAMVKPTVFKALFETYHGDTVSKAKLKQRAADLKVHPDETANCVDLYLSGMLTARLVTLDGDQVSHLSQGELAQTSTSNSDTETPDDPQDRLEAEESEIGTDNEESSAATGSQIHQKQLRGTGDNRPRAVFNVNVSLDSSLDIEKLQKQLDLLKRFGAI